MDGDSATDEKQMRLRYDGTCRVCGADLPARTEAVYERTTRTVRCLSHCASPATTMQEDEAPPIEPGVPGASARREFERRSARREAQTRKAHPKLGGLLHALSDDPHTTRNWKTGAIGEERLGQRLHELSSDTLRLLHDRRIPGTRANIDHLAVTPTGVFVIDAKKYAGRPHLVVEGGILRPRVEKLLVGSRNCTSLIDGMIRQVEVVRGVVGDAVPIRGVICFVDADWPLLAGAFTTRGVDVLWPKKLYPQLRAAGELGGEALEHLYRSLATKLPQA